MASVTDEQCILVIDDDLALNTLIAESLTMLGGYKVVVATDGASGLERFFEVAPDCVVVDVRMPGLDGYQFVRAMRGDGATAQTPIVMLSALIQENDQLVGLLSGADAYLLKPVKLADLLAAIHQAMALSAAQRDAQDRRRAGEGPLGEASMEVTE